MASTARMDPSGESVFVTLCYHVIDITDTCSQSQYPRVHANSSLRVQNPPDNLQDLPYIVWLVDEPLGPCR
jgi:hypothetical protein